MSIVETVSDGTTTKRVRHHMTVSVDVDRWSDAKLRKATWLTDTSGRPLTIQEIRIECHNARMDGFKVVPHPECVSLDKFGNCMGCPL